MMSLDQDTIVVATDDLSIAHLNGEAVLLDVQSGNYYGLNEVGARIIDLIAQPRPVGGILEALSLEYEADAVRLEHDVVAFLRNLAEHQLVRIEHAAVA